MNIPLNTDRHGCAKCYLAGYYKFALAALFFFGGGHTCIAVTRDERKAK